MEAEAEICLPSVGIKPRGASSVSDNSTTVPTLPKITWPVAAELVQQSKLYRLAWSKILQEVNNHNLLTSF